jgi:anti-sigma B factor antagonist
LQPVIRLGEELLRKMPLELVEEEYDGAVVVRVKGKRIDASQAPALKESVTNRIEGKPRKIVLDLSLVEFIDSIGLGVLVACFKRAGGRGRLAIVGAHGAVARLFKLTRMDQVFPLYSSLAEALKR